MSGRSATVTLLGFPRTGKSTYLGAMWQLAQDPAEPTIIERDVTGDRSYLQKLGEQVARGEELGRTETSSIEGMRLTLGFEQGDIGVHIPDLGGETLRLLVEDRVWHPRLRDTIDASDAIVLFLHPEKLRDPMPIAMVDDVVGRRSAVQPTDAQSSAQQQGTVPTAEPELSQFKNSYACTVAHCIDALENVLMYQRVRWPVRVVIVISAWDAVDGSPTPASWLRDRAPALESFANANTDMMEWNLYGVSAQGGKLPAHKEDLLARGSVRERVYARNAHGDPVAITEPLRWVLWK